MAVFEPRSMELRVAMVATIVVSVVSLSRAQIRLHGTTRSFGNAVAHAGDIDGDGHADVVVGEPLWNQGSKFRGRVWVFSGKDGRILFAASGPERSKFGGSVDGGSDIDGDGIPDMLVGAENRGSVTVLSGKDGSVVRVIPGTSPADHFGRAVAALGDVDGDGHDEIAAGGVESTRRGTMGFVAVYSGKSGKALWWVRGGSGWFGTALAAAGDVDKDGTPDVVVGERSDRTKGWRAGRVAVLSGKDGRLLHEWFGAGSERRFGASVTGAGDWNKDGHADVAALEPRGAPSRPSGPSVKVFSGADGKTLFEVSVIGVAWSSVSGGRDLDGDGWVDLAVGQVSPSRIHVYSGRSGKLVYSFQDRFARFGARVAVMGDRNKDGRDDLIVGDDQNNQAWILCLPVSTYRAFGKGCKGTFGVPSLSAPQPPHLGETFAVELDGLLPLRAAVVFLGVSDRLWNGVPLPADLTPFGAPGCTAYVSGDAAFPITPLSSRHRWTVPIPLRKDLLDGVFYNQCAVVDPSANALGLTTSNAGKGRVGARLK